jgi:gamma-glutamyl-gamma-aminobutyrate hydrolase PuuD
MTRARVAAADQPAEEERPRLARSHGHGAEAILALQRAHGNQALARALAKRPLQRVQHEWMIPGGELPKDPIPAREPSFYPDDPDKRKAEAENVGKDQHVKKALERRDTTAANVRKIKVGVTFRTDSNGDAHISHDLKAVEGISMLPGLPKFKAEGKPEAETDVGESKPDDEVPLQVEGVTLPQGASGPITPRREASVADLKDIDLLYIPGAPTANDTQTGMDGERRDLNRPIAPVAPQVPQEPNLDAIPKRADKNRATQDHLRLKKAYDKDLEVYRVAKEKYDRVNGEHTSRAAYELKLIALARSAGIPTIAICAGSWRLLESFGGEVETLPKSERDLHKAADVKKTWDIGHGVETTPGSMLSHMMGGKGGAKPMTNVNSTHWAVASEDHGRLRHKQDHEQWPATQLEPTAYSSGKEESSKTDLKMRTVEAFETTSGVPMLGVQWHPEAYLPGMKGEKTGSEEAQEQSKMIFDAMAKVALTSGQRRRAVNQELGGEPVAFKRFCEALKKYAEGKNDEGSKLYEQVAEALPKELWSARLDELERALELLQKAGTAEQEEANRLKDQVREILTANGVK